MKNYKFIFPFILFTLLFLFNFPTAISSAGNIILKSLIVNPSKKISQNIPFKVFLPKEISPQNIIDAAGCKIDFDYQSGKYFAHNDFELKPGESRKIEIVLKDIWKIPEQEIGEYKEKSDDLLKKIEGTKGYERATFLKNNMDTALNKIDIIARNESLNPMEYMKQYREVMELLKDIETQLAAQTKIKKEADKEKESVTEKMAWEIVITILISLTILCSIFLYLWFTKIRDTPTPEKENLDDKLNFQPEMQQKTSAEATKKVDLSDIENMLKNTEE